jgi:Nitronate monooxygenase
MITATRSPLHAALCARLGLGYPICQAGVAFVARGGPALLREEIRRVRGLAAALALGAAGVWMRTRFITTAEAHGPDNYKQKIAALDEEGTAVIRAVSGKPNRRIRNAFTREWEGRQAEIEPFPVRPAGRVVASIVEEAEAIFRRLGARGVA